MATINNLERRVTDRYRDGWDYLDEFAPVGTARMVGRKVAEGEDYDQGPVFAYRVRLSQQAAKHSRRTVERAIRGLFVSRCQHEHDCCGCAHYSVDLSRLGRRDYRAVVTTYYNY